MNKNNERSLNKFIRYPPLITNKIKYFGGNFMCGITAFSGKEEALPFLLQGLSKLVIHVGQLMVSHLTLTHIPILTTIILFR